MAKVIGPIKLKGTIGDISFYKTSEGNIAREKGKTGITKKQFAENPIFDPIRSHAKEFGSCSLKSKFFRAMAKQFYDQAKETSFAGRVNCLLFEILEEDTTNEKGQRQLENGLKTEEGLELLPNFEANKTRPLKKVCKKEIKFNWDKLMLNMDTINPKKDIKWPKTEANIMYIQLAVANWNYEEQKIETQYSNQLSFQKVNETQPLNWTMEPPKDKNLWLAYICISFAYQERKKIKPIERKFNTATILDYKKHK